MATDGPPGGFAGGLRIDRRLVLSVAEPRQCVPATAQRPPWARLVLIRRQRCRRRGGGL
jgi:hypothetical protein